MMKHTFSNEYLKCLNAIGQKEGWGIYESLGDKWEWRIEGHDDLGIFKDDGDAFRFIVKNALNGSHIHKEVIRFMAENGDEKEKTFLLKFLTQ